MDRGIRFGHDTERTCLLNNRFQSLVNFTKILIVKTPAGVSDADQFGAFVDADNESTEFLSGAARGRKPADHRLLLSAGLDLEPISGANAVAIGTGAVFGHDAFETARGGSFEKRDAGLFDEFAKPDAVQADNDLLKQFVTAR